jgi:hypothetical protein
MNHLAAGVASLLLAATAAAQVVWITLPPAGSPSGRYASAMTFESGRGQCILFGGHDDVNRLDDTWQFNGQWSVLPLSVRPAPRRWHAMAYDTIRNRTVLFGGEGDAGLLSDTWEFTGSAWLLRTPVHHPPARANHSMAYDTTRNRTVLIGGAAGTTTWSWNGVDWSSRPVGPTERSYAAMAFDSKRGRAVVFGGKTIAGFATLGDTWEYDGTTWTQLPGTNPPGRYGHAMAYDAYRERMVMAGGRDTGPFADAWELTASGWVQRNAGLANHYAPAMAFFAVNGYTVTFGGGTFPGVLADTQAYQPVRHASYFGEGPGCATAVLGPQSLELPYAGATFVREVTGVQPSFPLLLLVSTAAAPAELTPYGMPGCTLVPLAPVVQVLFASSSTVSAPLSIPNLAALAGLEFHDQVAVVANGANPAGLLLTNAMRGTVRLP